MKTKVYFGVFKVLRVGYVDISPERPQTAREKRYSQQLAILIPKIKNQNPRNN